MIVAAYDRIRKGRPVVEPDRGLSHAGNFLLMLNGEAPSKTAERAFDIALGKARPGEGESVDLIYSRLSHPNAEILEDQVVPLEAGAEGAAARTNSPLIPGRFSRSAATSEARPRRSSSCIFVSSRPTTTSGSPHAAASALSDSTIR